MSAKEKEFKEFQEIPVPLETCPETGDQFVKSFALGQDQEHDICAFMARYGFVCIRDVLSREEIDATVDEIWDTLEMKLDDPRQEVRLWTSQIKESVGQGGLVDKRDPNTWTTCWPRGSDLGMIGGNPTFSLQAMKNRQNEMLIAAFQLLLKEEDLLVQFDRYGAMRPTKNVRSPFTAHRPYGDNLALAPDWGGTVIDEKPEWRTKAGWSHVDANPWFYLRQREHDDLLKQFEYSEIEQHHSEFDALEAQLRHRRMKIAQHMTDNYLLQENNDIYVHEPKLQGMITLSDSRDIDGGFCCVPGFHNVLESWARQNQDTLGKGMVDMHNATFYSFPKDHWMHSKLQKIPARAGSLIVWNSRLPHCNYPNESDRFRFVQYVRMFPKYVLSRDKELTALRTAHVKKLLDPRFVPTEIGKQILGCEGIDEPSSWSSWWSSSRCNIL